MFMFPFVALHVSASVSFCSTHILHDICLQFVLVVLCYIVIVVLIWQAPLFLCKTISFYGYGQPAREVLFGKFPNACDRKNGLYIVISSILLVLIYSTRESYILHGKINNKFSVGLNIFHIFFVL